MFWEIIWNADSQHIYALCKQPHRWEHMSTIDDILWLLKDGEWHDLKEIAEKATLPQTKAEMVVSFLGEYNFVQLNENPKKVRLESPFLEFIKEIQRLEQETAPK